ncbi:MAG: PDZ domain-containing protein [Chitinophagales bacterium]|nr:PDZ domain-containing protein [Chitinophagales bacterium]MDW8428731.1 PDZ domain-containing protein [Chitinophagales bacterium]
MNRCLTLLFLLCVGFSGHAQPTEARLLRFPTVHGNQVVFTYAGDLYSVPVQGGVARKLTSDPGYECFARFSPDGRHIAFTGQFDGNTEVMLMPAQGGEPRRLTYTPTLSRDQISDRMGPNNIVMTWKDNEHIVYRSRMRSFNDFKGHLYVVHINGGPSEQLPFAVAGFCSFSPDGKQLALNRVFREFRTWKYYRGGMADDIWIFDLNTKQWTNLTQNDAQDIQPMWWKHKIFFLSDRDRTMNLFVYDVNTRTTRKVTHYTDYDIKFPSLGDGKIVFEKGGYLYVMDCENEQIKPIPVYIQDDIIWARSELINASKFIESWDVAPDGNRLVFVARGDVFTVPSEAGITRQLTRTSGYHERQAVWSPDGRYLAYISDESGEDEIYIVEQDGSAPPIRLTTGGDTYKYALRWSPNSKMLLFSDRKQVLQILDVETKKIIVIDRSDTGEFWDYQWSPDSRWVCYVRPQWQTNNVIVIYDVAKGTSHVVTDHWYESYQPIFSNDGKYLLFVSDRDFNPTFSAAEFQIAYLNMARIYLIPLSKKTPSPLAPKNNEVQTKKEETTDESGASKKKEADKKDKEKKDESKATGVPVEIDFDGILQRIIGLPVEAGRYSQLQYRDGKVYYLRSKAESNEPTLYLYNLEKREETELGKYDAFRITADGKKMALKKGEQYYVIDLPSSKISADKAVSLANMQIWVDRRQEWQGIFNECWRQMRDFFYAPNMHGVDWKAMKEKYQPLVPHVAHRADLTYVIGEMIGELNVGHAYVGGGDEPEVKRIPMGMLGARFSRHPSGYYRIDHILPGANWSSSLRSPLRDVGVNVQVGDYIIAVNGVSVQNYPDLYQALINTAGKTIELSVNSKPEAAGARKVNVVPVEDESDLYYFEWVQKNIRYVDSATGGKVGYLHIPNMGTEGLNEFMKYFYPQLNKKALIVDDRGNGGGFVSPLITERLAQRLVYFEMMRNTRGFPDPVMLLGPKVLLIDRYSASDGDIIAYRWRKYQIGKIIGVRTWGGVVGIRGSLPLLDGGYLMRPEFAPYNEEGWLIEGYGVDPDIVVDNDPYREYMGIDDQLNRAIEEILKDLQTQERNVPPVPEFPKR